MCLDDGRFWLDLHRGFGANDLGAGRVRPEVEVVGRRMTPSHVLTLTARQIAVDSPLIWEATPYYVELMTKAQANQRTSVVVYPIHDLVQEIPDFHDAPEFNLQALSQQSNQ